MARLLAWHRAETPVYQKLIETHDPIEHAKAKLERKRADLIVVNEVGSGRAFGTTTNAATVLGADGTLTEIGERPKDELADAVWDLVSLLINSPGGGENPSSTVP